MVIYCSVCLDELYREAKSIDKLGHDYQTVWTIDLEATCTTSGIKSHHCSQCDERADVTEVSAKGHEYQDDFYFDKTNHWKECACGEKIEIAQHVWNNGEITKKATVDEEGIRTYTCTSCSQTKVESISKVVVIIEDADSGVTLEIPSDSQAELPAGTVIDVIDKSNEQGFDQILGGFAETAEAVVTALGVYDLNLILDGEKIEPNGVVVVTLPAPKLTTSYDRIVVVYIAPDGSYEECNTIVNADGTISFETKHFSKYMVIGINEEDKSAPDAGAIVLIVVCVIFVVIGGFALWWFVIQKRTFGELRNVCKKKRQSYNGDK